MREQKLYPLVTKDPISGDPLHVTELSCESSSISIRGHFEIPRYTFLDAEQANFLEIFLRCRGILSSVEKELGVSYPTVRTKLDQLLIALDLKPIREAGRQTKNGKLSDEHQRVLDRLEAGEITPAEAKDQLRQIVQQD